MTISRGALPSAYLRRLLPLTAGLVSCSAIRMSAAGSSPAKKADLRYVSPAASDAADQVANPVKFPVELYPEIEAHDSGMLDVGDGHKLYYDVSGNPNGVPCIFLHGGPGAGCSPRSRRFFDPAVFRIVILDQRGSGKSVPNAADDLAGCGRRFKPGSSWPVRL